MNDEILEFIKSNDTPEMAELFKGVFEFFERLNVTDYILPFNELYMLSDNEETDAIITEMTATAEEMLVNVLNQHGIFVHLETNLSALYTILDAVMSIEYFDDPKAIQNIMEAGQDDEDTFLNILSLVSAQSFEFYATELVTVNPGLLRATRALIENRCRHLEEGVPETELIKQKAQLVKVLLGTYPGRSIMEKRLLDGLRLNLEYDVYYNAFWNEIKENSNEDIALDLLAMGIVSEDHSENVLEILKERVGRDIANVDDIGKIIDIATKYFLLLSRNSGVQVQA